MMDLKVRVTCEILPRWRDFEALSNTQDQNHQVTSQTVIYKTGCQSTDLPGFEMLLYVGAHCVVPMEPFCLDIGVY